ncbi:succinylglutamate desuccinylase/aspartoacylase family protein [Candidatus Gracilibacteria bacterium]|nr:succinylglutamate desuccinylase/aspartoacylase family protein [Candidatus Gracilibacteria bacterium]
MQIKYSFDSGKTGKNILILGSIHGDEPCGSRAIEKIREAILSGKISIQNGKITCIPYANFEAYTKSKRQITENLNRIFGSRKSGDIYDIAKGIEKEILENDFILDLHSFSSGLESFIFNDYNTEEINTMIRSIPIEYVMTGWVNLYEESEEMDTIGFAKQHGKIGITIECGENTDPESERNAYDSIISILVSSGNIRTGNKKQSHKQLWIHVDTIVKKEEEGSFIKEWKNFDRVKKGQLIGRYEGGNIIHAPYDGIMIMPNSGVEIGGEWCYFGKIIL